MPKELFGALSYSHESRNEEPRNEEHTMDPRKHHILHDWQAPTIERWRPFRP